jgi:hypothetical protein
MSPIYYQLLLLLLENPPLKELLTRASRGKPKSALTNSGSIDCREFLIYKSTTYQIKPNNKYQHATANNNKQQQNAPKGYRSISADLPTLVK